LNSERPTPARQTSDTPLRNQLAVLSMRAAYSHERSTIFKQQRYRMPERSFACRHRHVSGILASSGPSSAADFMTTDVQMSTAGGFVDRFNPASAATLHYDRTLFGIPASFAASFAFSIATQSPPIRFHSPFCNPRNHISSRIDRHPHNSPLSPCPVSRPDPRFHANFYHAFCASPTI